MINTCMVAISYCKGSVTRKCLQLILEAARTLDASVSRIVELDGADLDISSFEASLKNIPKLSKVLLKTSKTHFPALINPSRLDYDPTRNEFKRLSEELNSCCAILIALKNGHAADCLLKHLENRQNHDKLVKELKLKLDKDLCFYEWLGKDWQSSLKLTKHSSIEWAIRQIINRLKEFSKIKNFSDQINKLESLLKEIDTNGKGLTKYCEECGAEFSMQKGERWANINNGCDHILCVDCLKCASAKRGYMAYRCPICKKRLNKDWVLKRISGK